MDETIAAMADWAKKNSPAAIEKHRLGLDGKSILFKDAHGAAMEFVLSNENGQAHVSRRIFGVVQTPGEFQAAINRAQARHACNENYDEYLVSSTQFQINIGQPRSMMNVRYVFESPEAARAALASDEIVGIIDHVRELSEILEQVTASPNVEDGK